MMYLGDSGGDVRMFNIKNGELIKQVTDGAKDQEILDRFQSIMHLKTEPSPFKDATCLHFIEDEKILVVGTVDGRLKLYAEIDSEESRLGRVFVGGHKESEITYLTYWKETTQLASGSSNGIVCVWNLGSGKLDNIYFDSSSKVVHLSFCQPYNYIAVV